MIAYIKIAFMHRFMLNKIELSSYIDISNIQNIPNEIFK